ncbi:hypothetical protein [Hymenobacter sp. BT491]|uniref:hypothetical protein n=1 Tax=Hymenobacter sp. BT491 TaxID=2766779 RepID=UPI001653C595|nr:hypothetical protein [Hymenobacter sp. BT491]
MMLRFAFPCFLPRLRGGWLWPALVLWMVAGQVQAQQTAPAAVPDTTRIQPENTRPDSLRRRFDQERILTGLKAYTKRKTIVGKAASALFNFTERREDRAGLDAQLLDRQFDQHNYKIVRRINITTLDAFGYSINDPARQPRNFLEKTGNTFHIKTVRSRVRQVLLFRIGRELQPQALSESERLLRQTPEILDARVFVNEQTTSADSVDIEVVTKDVFSITGSFQLRDVGAGVVGVRDNNFLGQGHQFRNVYEYGRGKPQTWKYEGSYQVPFRNFVTGRLHYRNEDQFRQADVTFSRGFYSVKTRYAGSISLADYYQGVTLAVPPEGQPYVFHPLRYTVQDGWLGRSFSLHSYDLAYENPARLILSGRTIHTQYSERPITDSVNNKSAYRTTSLLLGTIGYSVRRYYKDKYLFGFGRTEDIPTGTLLGFTMGYELNEEFNRNYYGVRAAWAGYNPLHGYLYLNAEFGSFLRRPQNDWQQGLLNTEILYFTPLYNTGNWQWRHFFWNRSSLGFHRLDSETLLSIDGVRGLRGFQTDGLLRGASRFVVNYEANVFTPVSFLGFRLAAIAFADAAWITPDIKGGLPFHESPYMGFGAGLRFRNEYTAIRTLQILIGYYPRGQYTNNGLRIFESSRPYYGFNDFGFGQPNTARFD